MVTPVKQTPVFKHELEMSAMQIQLKNAHLALAAKENELNSLAAHTSTQCVICLDSMHKGKARFISSCGHQFHFECIKENYTHGKLHCNSWGAFLSDSLR